MSLFGDPHFAWRNAQSALNSAGPQAARIEAYWWLIFAVSALALILVVLAMFYALFHSRRRSDLEPEFRPSPKLERSRGWVVGILGAVTGVILLGLIAGSFATDQALESFTAQDALSIDVIGHQWWWEVQYIDPVPSRRASTANEIHVPVGRTVALTLKSHDVIHSFWAPNLTGKQDLIPGHEATLNFRADRAGVFRGQCAEFCGYQHAYMGFLVVAEPPDQFAAWLEKQRAPAMTPANPSQRRGQEVFLSRDCALCHTIQGTEASGKTAPDLTHLAGRKTLAAATLANNPSTLAAWIVDPQSLKPGNHMPSHLQSVRLGGDGPSGLLNQEDLQALLDYLGNLE